MTLFRNVKERRQRVRELLIQGKSNLEITNILKVPYHIVGNDVCRITRLEALPSRPTARERRESLVIHLWHMGFSNIEIADFFDLDIQEIQAQTSALLKKGVIISPVHQRRQLVAFFRQEGCGNQEIAGRLRVPEHIVINDAHRLIQKGQVKSLWYWWKNLEDPKIQAIVSGKKAGHSLQKIAKAITKKTKEEITYQRVSQIAILLKGEYGSTLFASD